MVLFNSNIKRLLIFSQKKAFLTFPEIEPSPKIKKNSHRENLLYFRKQKP